MSQAWEATYGTRVSWRDAQVDDVAVKVLLPRAAESMELDLKEKEL